ncbi:MAG TPA: hypothetical protein VN920_00580 [Pyrinomonadaceae bacterium]|nr:hypothetical protein [Pyrinomonadaceae bacterium]
MTAAPRSSAIKFRADQIKSSLDHSWLGQIYREQVLKMRTRSYHFGELPRRAKVEIQHTLLGVELKIGRRRLLCPDLPTARYLSIFARTRCKDVAIPYDITHLSRIADELESAWHRMLLLVDHKVPQTLRTRIRGVLIAKLRAEIAEAGAGTAIPEFKQSTRQRRAS